MEREGKEVWHAAPFIILTWSLVLSLAVFPARRSLAQPVPGEDELNRQGILFRKAGDDKSAHIVFQQAYERFHSPRSAAQLGLVEQALGRWEDAEKHVTESLRAKNDPWIEKYRRILGQSLSLIRQHVGQLEITGLPAGAEVLINGRSVGRLPLSGAVTVSVGEVDLQFRAPGHKTATRKLTLIGSQYERVFIRLDEDPSPNGTVVASGLSAGPAAGSPEQATSAAMDARHPPEPLNVRTAFKWTSLGLASASLATGIVASVIRTNRVDDFVAANGGSCREQGGRGVDLMGQPVAECQGSLDAIETAKTFQLVGFTGAVVLGTTWLLLQTLPTSKGSATAAGAGTNFKRDETSTATHRSAALDVDWNCVPVLASKSSGIRCALLF